MAFIIVATGFAIFKPTQLAWLTNLFGGYETARGIHLLMTIGLSSFFLIHIVQVVRSGFGNFWSMITGYQLRPATLSERVESAEQKMSELDHEEDNGDFHTEQEDDDAEEFENV